MTANYEYTEIEKNPETCTLTLDISNEESKKNLQAYLNLPQIRERILEIDNELRNIDKYDSTNFCGVPFEDKYELISILRTELEGIINLLGVKE